MAKNGGKMGKLFYGESGKKNWEIPHFFTHFFNNFIYFNRVFLISIRFIFIDNFSQKCHKQLEENGKNGEFILRGIG